jgi:hypothetical protein
MNPGLQPSCSCGGHAPDAVAPAGPPADGADAGFDVSSSIPSKQQLKKLAFFKKNYYLTAVKKNKQPAHARPGPVEILVWAG